MHEYWVPVQRSVDFRVGNIMDYQPHVDGPWDLIVFSETICYLGWLYPLFDVAWLAVQLFGATRPGGQLILANSMSRGRRGSSAPGSPAPIEISW